MPVPKNRLRSRVAWSLSAMTVPGMAVMWLPAASGATDGVFWVGLAVCAVAAPVFGWWLATRLLRPVDELRRRAERLVKGRGAAMVSGVATVSGGATASGTAATSGAATPIDDDEFAPLRQAVAHLESHSHERFRVLQAERDAVAVILDGMTEGVMALDGDSRIVLMNPAARRMLDCARAPVEGRALLEVVRDRGVTALVERCRALDAVAPYTWEIERHAPSPRTIEVGAMPMSLSTRVRGTVLVLRDVTERRRLERMRVEFVANVSHELRTPLTAIHGYLETLLDEAASASATHRRFLESANSHTERMRRLVDGLLNLSNLETGHVALDTGPVDARELANDVAAMFETDAAKRDVALVNRIPADARVRADRDRLSQILVNLVDNAVKASSSGGVVTFESTREHDHRVRLIVRDTGRGIPRTELPHVTERLYRVDPARAREDGGAGLGLAIVKHLVLLHGGTLHVDSEYGKGTTVAVVLPPA